MRRTWIRTVRRIFAAFRSLLPNRAAVCGCCFTPRLAELSPCAIDPLVRDVVRRRFDQALFAADVIGAKRIVFHSGFIPFVYYKEYFIDESVKFWRDFLKNAPNDMSFLLENVRNPNRKSQRRLPRA